MIEKGTGSSVAAEESLALQTKSYFQMRREKEREREHFFLSSTILIPVRAILSWKVVGESFLFRNDVGCFLTASNGDRGKWRGKSINRKNHGSTWFVWNHFEYLKSRLWSLDVIWGNFLPCLRIWEYADCGDNCRYIWW